MNIFWLKSNFLFLCSIIQTMHELNKISIWYFVRLSGILFGFTNQHSAKIWDCVHQIKYSVLSFTLKWLLFILFPIWINVKWKSCFEVSFNLFVFAYYFNCYSRAAMQMCIWQERDRERIRKKRKKKEWKNKFDNLLDVSHALLIFLFSHLRWWNKCKCVVA